MVRRGHNFEWHKMGHLDLRYAEYASKKNITPKVTICMTLFDI
jgi:hypothetical protein